MLTSMSVDARSAELADNLARVRGSIATACTKAGRRSDEVSLIVVTKTRPPSDVRLLAGLGVTDIGENRDQEISGKFAACGDLALRWHFIGQLQTNKCASVVRYAQVIHSVDRSRLVAAIDKAVLDEQQVAPVTCLVQVNLDGTDDLGRGGIQPSQAPALAAEIAARDGLVLGGVMGVAPLVGDPREAFDQLVQVSAAIRQDHSAASMVSAGMGSDFAAAIGAGATHVRIGTAVLGHRRPLR